MENNNLDDKSVSNTNITNNKNLFNIFSWLPYFLIIAGLLGFFVGIFIIFNTNNINWIGLYILPIAIISIIVGIILSIIETRHREEGNNEQEIIHKNDIPHHPMQNFLKKFVIGILLIIGFYLSIGTLFLISCMHDCENGRYHCDKNVLIK